MKINPKLLFETSGLSCVKIIPGEHGEIAGRFPARAVFVTDATVAKARAADPAARHDDAHFPDVRYGDILVHWTGADGSRGRMRAPAGMDAGIHLEFREDGQFRDLPISGIGMLAARGILGAASTQGEDHARALSGIEGVFQAVLADPDIDRFSAEMIGMAFMAQLTAPGERLSLSVNLDGFGRKARADLLKARIARISPAHPDSARVAASLKEIMGEVLPTASLLSARISGPALADEETLRRMVAGHADLQRTVFGEATTAPASGLSAITIAPDQVRDLLDGLAYHRLNGAWIEAIEENLRRISQARKTGDIPSLSFYSLRGRDLMVMNDAEEEDMQPAYVFSWPAHARALVQARGAQLNISREEIPSEAEIARLGSVLQELTRGAEHDSGLDFLESLSRTERD